jgi:hypothetical protein
MECGRSKGEPTGAVKKSGHNQSAAVHCFEASDAAILRLSGDFREDFFNASLNSESGSVDYGLGTSVEGFTSLKQIL